MAHNQILTVVALGGYAVVLLVGSVILAWIVGTRRLPVRIGVVVGLLLLGFAPVVVQSARGRSWTDPFLSRPARQEGRELVFEVSGPASEPPAAGVMQDYVDLASRRIRDAGHADATVSPTAPSQIAVFLPNADAEAAADVQRMLTMTGTLEFAIVANQRDHGLIIDAAQSVTGSELIVDGQVVAKWRPIMAEKDDRGRNVPNEDFDRNPEIAVRQIGGRPEGFHEVLVLYEPDESRRITGKLLKRANPTHDAQGAPAVGIHFNQTGGYLFHMLTSENKPRKDGYHRQLAVILNDQVVTAPMINQPIGDHGIIESSRFTEQDVEDLVYVLNSGAMPVQLKDEPVRVARLDAAPDYHVSIHRASALARAAVCAASAAVLSLLGGGLVWQVRRQFGAGQEADKAVELTDSHLNLQ